MDQLGGYGSDAGSDSDGAPVIQADGEHDKATLPAFPGKAPDKLLCIQLLENFGDFIKSCRSVCLRPGVQDPNLHTEQPGESGPLLSKLPAPKKKRRPILLTALARPIPDSESDVRTSLSLTSVCPSAP